MRSEEAIKCHGIPKRNVLHSAAVYSYLREQFDQTCYDAADDCERSVTSLDRANGISQNETNVYRKNSEELSRCEHRT